MEESRRVRITAMVISLLGGIVILLMKFYASNISNSTALRSDAIEGTVNIVAAIFGLGSLFFAEKPADRDHPYGHGKIEYFAQAFEGGLIAFAGVFIVIETIDRFYHHPGTQDISTGLKVNLISGLLNGVLGVILLSIGKKHHSTIIRADGIHLLADLVTTIAIGFGLGIMLLTGWEWVDPALALMVALFLFHTGYKLVQQSSKALLDAENPELIDRIVVHLNEIQQDPNYQRVITVHDLKAQEFGRDKHVDIHLVLPEFLSIKEAHDFADRYASSLHQLLGHESEVHTHIDPCEKAFCKQCPYEPCTIRKESFEHQAVITAQSATERGEHPA